MRQDFAGGWPGDPISGFTGQGLAPEQKEAQAYLRQLGALRAAHPLIGRGSFMQFTPDMGSFAYAWYSDSEVILMLANGDEVLRTWPVERFAELGLKPGTSVIDLLVGGGFTAESSLDFEAKGIRVLKFNR
jgi:hypothetical protein